MLKAKDTGIFEIFGRLFSQKFRENQQLLKLLTERSPLILTSANAKLYEFKTLLKSDDDSILPRLLYTQTRQIHVCIFCDRYFLYFHLCSTRILMYDIKFFRGKNEKRETFTSKSPEKNANDFVLLLRC